MHGSSVCLQLRDISWFQMFAVFWMLYAFFWVIPQRLNFMCQHFGTLWLSHLHRPMKMGQSVPKHQHVKFRHRGITQKKAYNFVTSLPGNHTPNTATVWSQSCGTCVRRQLAHSLMYNESFISLTTDVSQVSSLTQCHSTVWVLYQQQKQCFCAVNGGQ